MSQLIEASRPSSKRSRRVVAIDRILRLEDSPSLLDDYGPIFILGCPRSGTTVLAECVGSLERIEAFIGVLAPPRKMHWIGHTAAMGGDVNPMLWVVRDIFWQSFWRRHLAIQERLVQVLKRRKSVMSLFRGNGLKGSQFCYKEPFMCFAVEQLARHFPNAKFIHIVRDGRDSADSIERTYPLALTDKILTQELLANNNNSEIGIFRKYNGYCIPWWVPAHMTDQFISMPPYGRYLCLWRESVSRVLACGRTLAPKRYLQIKYEDFVADPAKHGEQLLAFLGCASSSGFRRRLHGLHGFSTGIARRNQPSSTLDLAGPLAGELLTELGYAV